MRRSRIPVRRGSKVTSRRSSGGSVDLAAAGYQLNFGTGCDECLIRGCPHRDSPTACRPFWSHEPKTGQGLEFSLIHPDAADLLESLNFCELPTGFQPSETPRPPSFIIQPDPGQIAESAITEWMALPLDRFVSRSGKSFATGMTLAKRWKDLGAKRLLLVAAERDELLETLWNHRQEMAAALREAKVNLTTALSYSAYVESEPIARIFNISRAQRSYVDLLNAGLSCIPSVNFGHPKEGAWLGSWIVANGIDAAFIDLQSSHDLTEDLLRQCLEAFLGRATTLRYLLVNGVASIRRMRMLLEIVKQSSDVSATFVSKKPYLMACSGRELVQPSGKQNEWGEVRTDAKREEIYRALIHAFGEAASGRIPSYQRLGAVISPLFAA
jgi:hypothetical protein